MKETDQLYEVTKEDIAKVDTVFLNHLNILRQFGAMKEADVVLQTRNKVLAILEEKLNEQDN